MAEGKDFNFSQIIMHLRITDQIMQEGQNVYLLDELFSVGIYTYSASRRPWCTNAIEHCILYILGHVTHCMLKSLPFLICETLEHIING